MAYYLFGASIVPDKSFALMWRAFKMFHRIDLTGCNVPEIGHYKRGLGGELKCYLGAVS